MDGESTCETPARLRSFGLTAGALVAILFGVLLPWKRGGAISPWPFAAGAALVLPALVAPRFLAPVHRGFTVAGSAIGWVNTRVVLGLVYFLLLVPMGLAMRLAGRDALGLRIDPAAASYRVPSVKTPVERMEVPY